MTVTKSKSRKSAIYIGLVGLAVTLIAGGCRNPFQVGLGDKVDLEVPEISLNSHPAGAYLSGTVTLGGDYIDDFGIDGVTLSFDNGATVLDATLNSDDATWSYVVDTSAYQDGEIEILLTVTDQSGKDVQKRVLYYFDNTAPLVMVTIPQNYGANEYNGNITVKGEAADQFGISALEYRLLDTAGAELATWADADGTSSWSVLFDSSAHIPTGSGTIAMEIRATDRAGNVSSSIIHNDDVLANNGLQPITAEALIKILRGESVSGATISAAGLAAIQLASLELDFNQDLDAPTFVISNPDQNESLANNGLSGNPRFTGTVEDDAEGVDPASIQFRITDYDTGVGFAPYDNWTNVSGTTGSGLLVRWTADVAGLVDGSYNMQVRANDTGTGTGASGMVPFQVDTGAPTVLVSSPNQGEYVNGAFVISGTATDGTGVASIEVSVNSGPWNPGVVSGSAPNFTWTANVDPSALGLADGPISVKIQAADSAGSTATFNLQLILDTTAPTATFINPAASSTVNGQVIVRGTASDNSQVTLVEVRVGDAEAYLPLTGTYNWERTVDVTAFANEAAADEVIPPGNVWDIEVFARITDVAGNVNIVSYNFFIDNDLDRPRATVLSPEDGQAISGSVFVAGTATDDDAVAAVYMQLDVNGDGDYADSVLLNATTFDETAVITVDGTTAWSYELNGDGELYYADGLIADDGWVTMKVWVQDINGLDGNPVEQTIQFDDTKARVDGLDLSSGDYVRGTFQLTGDVIDDTLVTSVEISTDGGASWTSLTLPVTSPADGLATPAVTSNANWTATLTETVIDSPDMFDLVLDVTSGASGLDIDSGILYLRIRVDDGTDFFVNRTTSMIDLYVDNNYPSGSWDYLASDPLAIQGSTALVQGTATDTGTISGIDQIHVYFVQRPGDGGEVYDLDPTALAGAAGTASVVSTDFGASGGGIADYTPANGAGNSVPYYHIAIDNPTEDGNDSGGNGDGDTFNESITLNAGTYNWYAYFDSTVIPDGPIDIHYVVFDSSGNGHHYLVDADTVTGGYQPGFVTNNRPSINGITLGTNLDFSGGAFRVEADEQSSYSPPFSIPATSVRDRLYVEIDASDPGGGIASYELFLTNSETWNSGTLAADTELDGSGGTPTLSGTYAGGAEIDVTLFGEGDTVELYALLTDTDGITVREDFSVVIDNADTVRPNGSLTALTDSSVVNGHVESSTESRDFSGFYNGTFNADATADVSGTVSIAGSADDDQRIQTIELRIYKSGDAAAGYDGGGAGGAGDWFTIASWDATDGRLEYNDTLTQYAADTPTENQTLTVSGGHDTDFSFDWNSALIRDVAEEDIIIELRVTDFAPQTQLATVSRTVDVVPYITGIDRNDGILQTRTKLGKYTVPDGLTGVEVYGYNLDPSSVTLYNTSGGAFTAQTNVTDTSPPGPVPAAAPFTSFSFDVAGDYSGYLWVDVAGVTAINNFNDNSLDQNKQDDGSGIGSTLWRDDLYIHLWDVDNDFQGSADAEYAAMAVNSAGLHYAAWSYYSDSERRYGTDTQVRTNYGGNSWDPNEWNDIAFNHVTDDFFIVNLWNQNVGGTMESLRVHSFEGTAMSDDTDVIDVDDLVDTLYRFQNPRIAVKDNGGGQSIVYVSYYDGRDAQRDLKFASFLYNGTNNLTSRTGGTNITVDATGDVGYYSDVAIDGDGYPFIVYFDTTNKRLKIARAANDNPTALQWDIQVVDSGLTNFGEYVSAAVESNGDVHISTYQNSYGDLVYYEAADTSYPTPFSFTRTTVDTEDNVGQWSEIAVDSTEPYISYVNVSGSGTPEGLKYAYRDAGVWEHGTVPVGVSVQTERVGVVEKPTTSTYTGAADYVVSVSYNAGAYYFARLRPEQ